MSNIEPQGLLPMTEENRASPQLDNVQSRRFQLVCKRLRAEFGDDFYDAWFDRLVLTRANDGEAILAAPTKFIKVWIDAYFLERLRACFAAEFAEIKSVSVIANEAERVLVLPHPPAARDGMAFSNSIVAGD
jgi:chromosomal replication initiator protein